MYNVLAELVEEEKNLEEDKNKNEKLTREVEGWKEEKEQNEERHDAESITADTLERLLWNLNEDYVSKDQVLEEKVKLMR